MARKKPVDSIPEHRTPRSAAKGLYVFPDRPPHSKGDDVGSYPIGDVFHARLALIYVLANKPWFNRDREDVIQAVEDHYPEYNWAAWWNRERRGKPWLRPFKDYLEERYARAANPRNPFTRRKNGGDFTVYHADHGIKPAQLDHIKQKLVKGAPQGFFIKQIVIPAQLGKVPNAMYGPEAGDPPVREGDIYYERRGGRAWSDRMTSRPVRPWNYVQAIGTREGNKFTLFTVYGGPLAPQHPDDPNNQDPEGSRKFWSKHALSDQQWKGNPRRKNAGSTIPAKRKLRAKYRKKHGANWHEKKAIHNRFKDEWKKIRSK